MDPRVEDHADVVVDHSVGIEAGDEVIVSASPAAEDLVVPLEERIGERGAHGIPFGGTGRSRRAFMRAMDPENYDGPSDALMAMAEEIDVAITIRASRNTHETGDVPPEKTPPTRRS